jgi:long-chain acyl-CoA synthetase
MVAALAPYRLSPGDRVMLQGFNRIEWVVCFWALHCLGVTVALGNAWWSAQETADAIRLVSPRLVIAERDAPTPSPAKVSWLTFAQAVELAGQLAASKAEPPLRITPVDEEAAAVIIFSSGTTGEPKGAVLSHRAVIANIQSLLQMTGRLPSQLDASHSGTVNLVTMPLFHQGGMQISVMTLLTGGTVVFLRGKFDPVEVLQVMQSEKVRAWGSVPTMVSRVLQHPAFASYDTHSVSSIQMGGAPIPHELREQVAIGFPNSRRRVGSMYGLTETGVVATGAGADIADRPGCVGRPLPMAEIVIAHPDSHGVGEIKVRTASAMTGYLNEPAPIADADGWIASGDLGRFDDEGRLYVVGRSKDMIIRGGENVASAHVERCIRTHPDVLEVAVVPLPHADLGEEVAAAVVLKPGSSPTVEELKAHLADRLARFEIPSRWWLRHDPLPLNATGKVVKLDVLARWPANASTLDTNQ